MITVAIVADIRLYREGLALALDAEDDLGVVATMGAAPEAPRAVRASRADVVLLDMAVPDSLGLAALLADDGDGASVIALAIAETDSSVIACAEAGAGGYIPRDASLADVAAIVRSVAAGETVCSPRIAAGLLRRLAVRSAAPPAQDAAVRLTPREAQILDLIEEGLSNKEIGLRLCIEVATVKNHVHNILEKLNVRRRAEAAAHLRRVTGRGPAVGLPS
jgi:two-component system, NarL family, nitrate/nitrite response regulator NarL